MNSNKKGKKSEKPSQRPDNHLVSGLEDLRVKVKEKNAGYDNL